MAKRLIGALKGLSLWRFGQWMAQKWADALNRATLAEAEREKQERDERKEKQGE